MLTLAIMGQALPDVGPWAHGITAAERTRRWRQMVLEAITYCGDTSPVVRACVAAELDAHAAERALRELLAIDSRKRERIMLAGTTRASFLPPSATDFSYRGPERRGAAR